MVPTARFELARLSPPPPQDGVATNFTTSAKSRSRYSTSEFDFVQEIRYFFLQEL